MAFYSALKLTLVLQLASTINCLPKVKAPVKSTLKSHPCECSLFLKNDLWLPKYEVISLTNDYQVDCTDLGGAAEKCKVFCANEVAALFSIYQNDPSVLRDHPPSQSLPCNRLPVDTVSFAKFCGSQSNVLTSKIIGPPICCDAFFNRIWCGSSNEEGKSSSVNLIEGRKLNLEEDQNALSNNEIDDSSDFDSKPGKKKQGSQFLSPASKSWMYTALKYFGYGSFSDLVKGIDIFSLPVKIQAAVRTYKDEVSLGRCYMEFTTFKVFTKQENPFEDFLRKKRSTTEYEEPITRFDEFVMEGGTSSEGLGKMMPFDGETIKNLLNGVAGILQRSDSTKQFADILTSFLPIVTQLVNSGSADATPSPASLLFKFVGPLLSQMGSINSPPSNNIDKAPPQKQTWPDSGPSSVAASSPFSTMAMSMIGNVLSNFFTSPDSQNRIKTTPSTTTTTRPTKPSTTPAPSVDIASSGIRTLLKLFLQSAAGSTAVARPIEIPKPLSESLSDKPNLTASKKEEKRFIHMLLELIRPVFISIVGNAPGDNGVKEIRKVSTLSTLGRVDDTLREEVDSPFFCFKKYLINKAWSVTENGVRSVVSTFTPEEQARMMKSISSRK